jgi:glycerol-1-phosphate dehydrogenase [NAD(P)+]
MDTRTKKAAGDMVYDALISAGLKPVHAVLDDIRENEGPQCDAATVSVVIKAAQGADIIIAVGSGVINDLAKWASFEMHIPYICFATAASMNGYSSANVAVTANSVKTIARARPPYAVISTPYVLCEAPYRMTASGLGDVLAKSVSSADWKMNSVIFKDYYCERSAGLIGSVETAVMKSPERLAKRDSAAIEDLFDALLLTGAAMTMAESSAPASGGEHLISHALDMMSLNDGKEHDLHGRQVGVATILASELYNRVMALESPLPCREVTADTAFWGKTSDEVARHFSEKIERFKIASQFISSKSNWDLLRSKLVPLTRSPSEIRESLKKADAAYRACDIYCSKGRLYDAFIHAHEIRSRFTILDLAWITGILPGSAREIIEAWA